MLNTYNRFRPRAPDARQLGQRLVGGGRVNEKLPVTRPPVATFFDNALAARSMVTQPTPYNLGANNGLAGFGRFGALGAFGNAANTIFAEFAFGEAASARDFFKLDSSWNQTVNQAQTINPVQYAAAGSYTAPPTTLISAANAKWAAISEARYLDTRVEAFARGIETTINGAIAQADSNSKVEVDAFARRRTVNVERLRIDAFKKIIAAMTQVAQYVVPPTAPSQPDTFTSPATSGQTGTTQAPPTGWSTGAATGRGTRTAPPQQPQQAITEAPQSNMGLYIGGGIALLAVGGIALVLLRKK
jgi:hypothetical protein